MQQVEQVSSLIADIYDAALDPTQWDDILCTARDFVGGAAAAVFSKDASSKSLNVYYQCGGVDPHYQQLYVDQYAKLDPSTTVHVMAEIEQPISTADIMALDEFTNTRFYQEWGRPQGLVDTVCAVLDRSATGAAMFGVFRQTRHGLADDDMRWRMRQIVPHIRRAMLIGRAIDLKTAEASAFADTLDGISAGMFLVDGNGADRPRQCQRPCPAGRGGPRCVRTAGGSPPSRPRRIGSSTRSSRCQPAAMQPSAPGHLGAAQGA